MRPYFRSYLKSVYDPLPEMRDTFDLEEEFFLKMQNDWHFDNVMDFGCGIGRPLIKLAKNSPKSNFIGVDNDTKALAVARMKSVMVPNVHFVIDDILKMDTGFLEPETFNMAYSTFNLIGCFEEKDRGTLVKKMAETVHVGGFVINATWSRDIPERQFQKYYEHIGVKVLDIDREKTVTDRGTFYRVAIPEIMELYKANGIWPVYLSLGFDVANLGYLQAVVGQRKK